MSLFNLNIISDHYNSNHASIIYVNIIADCSSSSDQTSIIYINIIGDCYSNSDQTSIICKDNKDTHIT